MATKTDPQKTKAFCIATEGDTIDGREITAQWIDEMAETYNPKTYGARIWLEHIRGTLPDSPFKAYGDILKAEARDVDGKRALFGTLSALPDLVAMNKAGQKVYSSIEVAPNFAKTGKAYLVGMGVTDSPSSLGTDRLEFSSRHGKRELPEGHLFSVPIEVDMEFESDPEPSRFAAVLDKIKNGLRASKASTDTQFNNVGQVLESVAEGMSELRETQDDTAERLQALEARLNDSETAFSQFRESVENTPAGSDRPPAAGGQSSGYALTDC